MCFWIRSGNWILQEVRVNGITCGGHRLQQFWRVGSSRALDLRYSWLGWDKAQAIGLLSLSYISRSTLDAYNLILIAIKAHRLFHTHFDLSLKTVYLIPKKSRWIFSTYLHLIFIVYFERISISSRVHWWKKARIRYQLNCAFHHFFDLW